MPAIQFGDGHRTTDVIPLRLRATYAPEGFPGALVLDALGHDVQAEAAAQLDRRAHDRRAPRVPIHLADERLLDLEL